MIKVISGTMNGIKVNEVTFIEIGTVVRRELFVPGSADKTFVINEVVKPTAFQPLMVLMNAKMFLPAYHNGDTFIVQGIETPDNAIRAWCFLDDLLKNQ